MTIYPYLLTEAGTLTAWTGWLCDVECGIGTQTRTRQCLPIDEATYDSECPLNCDDSVVEESGDCDMGECKYYICS